MAKKNGTVKKETLRKFNITIAKKRKAKKEAFLAVYPSKACNISETCRAIGEVSRSSVMKWREVDEEFAQKIEDAKEDLKDFAESKLIQGMSETVNHIEEFYDNEKGITRNNKQLMTKASIVACLFFLKTRCKDRGYIERAELTGQGGGPLGTGTVNIYIPDNNRDKKPDGN